MTLRSASSSATFSSSSSSSSGLGGSRGSSQRHPLLRRRRRRRPATRSAVTTSNFNLMSASLRLTGKFTSQVLVLISALLAGQRRLGISSAPNPGRGVPLGSPFPKAAPQAHLIFLMSSFPSCGRRQLIYAPPGLFAEDASERWRL